MLKYYYITYKMILIYHMSLHFIIDGKTAVNHYKIMFA